MELGFLMGFVTPSYTSVGSYYTYGVVPSSQSSKFFFLFFSGRLLDVKNCVSPYATLLFFSRLSDLPCGEGVLTH